MIKTEFKHGQKVKRIASGTVWLFVGIDPRDNDMAIIVQPGFPPETYQRDRLEPVRESKGFIVVGFDQNSMTWGMYSSVPRPKKEIEGLLNQFTKLHWTNLQIVEVFE